MTLRVWIYQTMVRKDHPLQSCWIWSQRPELSPLCPETPLSLPQRWAPCLCNVFFSLQTTGCRARAAGGHNKLHFSYLDKLLCPRYLSPVPLVNGQCTLHHHGLVHKWLENGEWTNKPFPLSQTSVTVISLTICQEMFRSPTGNRLCLNCLSAWPLHKVKADFHSIDFNS